jgi:hypothetical protein
MEGHDAFANGLPTTAVVVMAPRSELSCKLADGGASIYASNVCTNEMLGHSTHPSELIPMERDLFTEARRLAFGARSTASPSSYSSHRRLTKKGGIERSRVLADNTHRDSIPTIAPPLT